MTYLAPQELRTFFVTSVTHGRRRILQSEVMATLLIDVLQQNRTKSRFLLHEYVVMPNHFHLLITPAYEVPLEKAVQFVKGGFSYRVKKELNRNWEIWERSFTNQRIRNTHEYEAYRLYIHNNPVRASLVEGPEAWPYSSACTSAEVDPAPPALKRTSRASSSS